ncbi:hypothetical protein GCM10008929_22300 [Alkalibacterium psychrotolerans]
MNSKSKQSLIRFIGIGLIIALFAAILWTIVAIAQDFSAAQETVGWGSVFFISTLLITASSLFFYSHILIHEGGHLLAGLLSGYTFLLFRMGRFGLIKENQRFKLITYRMSGTLGQCLMYPPDTVIKPFRLYLSGGVLGNLLASTAGLSAYVLFPTRYFILFSLIGLVAAVTNGIPIGYNDGKILSKLLKSETAQEQFFQQLRWNGDFIRYEKVYSDVVTEDKIMNVNQPVTEQFNIYTKLVEIHALLEKGDLNAAFSELSDLYDLRLQIIVPYRMEVIREYLFCLIMLDRGKPNEVSRILSEQTFKEHLKLNQADVFRLRCVVAYYVSNDRNEAKVYFNKAEEYLDKLPFHADRAVNRQLLDIVIKETELK